jgi:hypothetical protein
MREHYAVESADDISHCTQDFERLVTSQERLMTDDTLFAGHRPKGRQRKPGERVWTMTKGGEEAWAELRDQGVAGVELQLFRGEDFANGRLYSSREAAIEASTVPRQQMTEKGWCGA